MNLTESKLFTIEALNRIEGFVWPDGAEFASMNGGVDKVSIWSNFPVNMGGTLFSGETLVRNVFVHGKHPEWSGSVVTKEEFYSVDGWVRSWVTSVPGNIHACGIEVECGIFGRKWRYRKPKEEKGMTLLEILVRELPKRGGWSDFAESCVQGAAGTIHFTGIGHGLIYRKNNEWECDNSNYSDDVDFHSEQLATDHATKIVTRDEYVAAVKAVAIEWFDSIIERENEKPEAQKDLEDWNAKVMKAVSDGLIHDLYALNDAIGKAFNEKSEELNKLAKSKAEVVSAIKSWHKERGFDVSEVKQTPTDAEVAKAMVDFLLPKDVSKEVRDKAPLGSTHYDGECGGHYLQRIGESWMMYVKGDWIKCDPDEQVLSRLITI